MHEMSVAQNIIEIVKESIVHEGGAKVRTVRLKVGEFAGIVPESLEFCFNSLIDGTSLQGASLSIDYIPLLARCNTCNTLSRLEYGFFVCRTCGSRDIKMVSGTELQVVDIELADDMGIPS